MGNKLTDNEIKKALECCLKTSGINCGECPYCDNCISDENTSLMMTDALDLINRLEAENEEQDKAIINALKKMGEIRAEAVKEFAERLNKEAENAWIDIEGGFIYSDSDNTAYEIYDTLAEWCKEVADNILKEMEGEQDA